MTKVTTLTGVYNVQGQSFTQPGIDFRLILSERKNSTPTHPKLFLIAKPLHGDVFQDGRNYRYISSLFQDKQPNHYHFDFEGVSYNLLIEGKTAKIEGGGKVL